MKKSKSLSLAVTIAVDLAKEVYQEGYIGLVMERPSETAHLSPLEQLFYKEIRKDIEALCTTHNRLWDSNKDIMNPDRAVVTACLALEHEVNALNDMMNDLLDDAFDNLTYNTIEAKKLNEKTSLTLLRSIEDKAFLYEKSKAKKSA